MHESLYETDFYAWTQVQAKAIRARAFELVDIENLVEEVESLGRREKQQLEKRLSVLIGHLLKWQFQPQRRSNSWLATIREQRRKIRRLLLENPSLQPAMVELESEAYKDGLDLAVRETDLPFEIFSGVCPYALEDVLDDAFLPADDSSQTLE
ncbi:DUF29 domain-containing protein [Gloeobacter morelensis]|uniref:DUF29 domain-containing protein n=1 Tax=Gloeobacter morelensis MG652769 TaxID=2781736 RepID=A0ABY3PN83_9CYAN|nr:DUF29 domain-containing protein [Gloeobacter morelensis]UFP95074.1 DUF29 domain-containing protein [Gloeobacter morelensis MG652769]